MALNNQKGAFLESYHTTRNARKRRHREHSNGKDKLYMPCLENTTERKYKAMTAKEQLCRMIAKADDTELAQILNKLDRFMSAESDREDVNTNES